MLRIKEYVLAASLEEAYELNQKRNNRILGGMLWMRMSNRQIQKGIDLSGLGLDKIEETEEAFFIGCMVTLRQIEQSEALNTYTSGLMKKAVEDIVGVQFRNLATIGGSVFGRFGFSDVLTSLLVLDTYVELYKGGVVSLADFVRRKRDRDILVRIIIKKEKILCTYQTYRNTKTDFPVLAAAASKSPSCIRLAVGARPARADVMLVKDLSEESAAWASQQFTYGSNMRASREYRMHLGKVLCGRAFADLREMEEEK